MKETTSRLLAHSKEFFVSGERELEQNTAMAYMQAVLKFHDAVEFSVRAVVEEHNVNHDRNMDLLPLMKCVDQSISTKKLPLASQMDFLNTTRGKVKHHASVPSLEDVQRCRRNSGDFIGQVAKDYLGADFHAISRSLLVENISVRRYLELAESKTREGDYLEALIQVKKAFYVARPSEHTFIAKASFFQGFFLTSGLREVSGLKEPIEAIVDKINELEESIALLMMGVDILKLRRFEEITPQLDLTLNRRCTIYWDDSLTPTEDLVREAIAYVIDMTMLWQSKGVVASRADRIKQRGQLRNPWREVRVEQWHYSDVDSSDNVGTAET